jgi:hypothetical protein
MKISKTNPLNKKQNSNRQFFIVILPISFRQKNKLNQVLNSVSAGKQKGSAALLTRTFFAGDDVTKKGKQDDIRVNINESWERRYWSKKLGISQTRLKQLVKIKGPLVRNLTTK